MFLVPYFPKQKQARNGACVLAIWSSREILDRILFYIYIFFYVTLNITLTCVYVCNFKHDNFWVLTSETRVFFFGGILGGHVMFIYGQTNFNINFESWMRYINYGINEQ